MRKLCVLALVAVFASAIVFGCAKGYEAQQKAGDLTITLSTRNYPLVQADNTLDFTITDSDGKVVTDAKVDVRYYMPPMPGMTPMDYVSEASFKDDRYSMTAHIPMAGRWMVEVAVKRTGTAAVMTAFTLDAQ